MSVFPMVPLLGETDGNWQAAQAAHYRAIAASYQANYGANALPFGARGQAASPPEPIEDAGIGAGEIVGWRAWYVVGGFLTSVVQGTVWARDEALEARGAIEDYGQAGIYAYRTQSDALTGYVSMKSSITQAVGRVLLWGAVIEHERGYRAEFARVVSIDHLIGGKKWFRSRRLQKLRSAYGVA